MTISLKMRFIIAILMGVMASGLTAIYLRGEEKRIQERFKMTTVLCTKRFVPSGQLLSGELLEERQAPVVYLQPTAVFSKKEILSAQGAALYKSRDNFMKGEQITRSKLIPVSEGIGLSWSLPAGTAAMALRLDLARAVAGLVQPGDHVNVICASEMSGRSAHTVTTEILKGVPVVAVDDAVWDPDGAPLEKTPNKDLPSDSILVTLAVPLKQTAAFTLAADRGRLTLALLPSAEGGEHKK